jgi:phosphate transporter
MKFSQSLTYNSVPEWQDKYINYVGLKKTIYALAQEQLENPSSTGDGTKGSSNSSIAEDPKKFDVKAWFKTKSPTKTTTVELTEFASPEEQFLEKLEGELLKIDEFYKLKERELYIEYESLIEALEVSNIHLMDNEHMLDETRSILSHKSSIAAEVIHAANSFNLGVDVTDSAERFSTRTFGHDDDDDEDDRSYSDNSALLSDADLNLKTQKKITLKRQTTDLFVDLSKLKSFIELNRIGFSKIAKKFDKLLNSDVRARLFNSNQFFENSYTFQFNTLTHLDKKLNNLVEAFASLTNRLDDLDGCKKELRSFLREHIVCERNTVWKEMIGIEARTNTIKGAAPDAPYESELFQLQYYSWPLPRPVNLYFTKWENIKLPKFINSPRTYKLAIIITITGILLGVKTFHDEAQHRCMALLACVALLWATEAIPLFATSLLCPLLVVLFRVSKDSNDKVMGAAAASSYILSNMWSSTIMVLLGGFTLAAALSKYNVAKIAASWILSGAGTKPRNILLSMMGVALFLSMWISNVATPVLCYSLIQGVLRSLDTDSQFAKALILGVALASNIGGMPSPIASPQNIVAMEYLTPYGVGWGKWLAVALPVSIIAMVLVWVMLILTFKVSDAKVMKYKPIKDKLTIKQWYILFVFVATIILWCVESQIESEFGSAGLIAVFPMVLFFGTGLLTTADINNFPWSIVILAMGSLALGKAVSSSGLLSTIAVALQRRIINYSMHVILMIFGILILVIGTFVSHTVSAIIIIPLVQEIGDNLPDPSSAPMLIFGIALLASCGMGLASSGFPNVTAISMTDEIGTRYLSVSNFITRGVPASLIAYIVVITVGYGIMKATF